MEQLGANAAALGTIADPRLSDIGSTGLYVDHAWPKAAPLMGR
jgi:hypothetical protein